ncbi:MAG TPA: hypothetical protein VK988_22610 [Acidimicrobiales bacterium]|nr:hypothetical protein [Acidimicrobiales bacterium]
MASDEEAQSGSEVVDLEDLVEKVRGQLESWSRGDLVALHQSFAVRFTADNAGIWSTGSIFVPASYAVPAIYLTSGDQTWAAFAVLSALSTLLIASWLVIAENHRAFQQRSDAIMRAIELVLELEFGKPKVVDSKDRIAQVVLGGNSKTMEKKLRVRAVRRSLVVILSIIWLLIGIGKIVGDLLI